MAEDVPTLEVGFAIETGASFEELTRLQQFMNSTEAQIVREAANIERATGGMVKVGTAITQIQAFGAAATREMQAARRETANAERAGEAMTRQLTRQIETFGKTASEIRNMRAEQRALAAEGRGLTELAGRIRGLNAEMMSLEISGKRGAAGVGASGNAMAALAPQAQDMATQVSMGANVFSVLAIQGGQAASQMVYLGGVAGKFGTFMMGPWGLALQAGLFALGALTKGLFDNAEATKAVEVAADNTASAQGVLGDMFDLTTGKIKSNTQALRDNIYMQMVAMQQKAIIARTEADQALNESGAGRTSAGTRFWERLKAYATRDAGAIAFTEQQLARREASGRQFQSLGRGVAQGGISREEAGRMIEAQRKKLGDDTYFALQGFLNKSSEEFTATNAVRAMEKALKDGKLDSSMLKVDETRKKSTQSTDKHAEALAREADAVEAQVRNLYALAGAYGDSGAAALIAEARVKAESDAIKKRGDVDAMVNRQIQVAIAQRVADAAKGTAGMREQAAAQENVNAMVAAGIVPASAAADLVKDQLADLPLLAAIQAAQQRGLKDEADKATAALEGQRQVRLRLRDAEENARFNTDKAAGDERLAQLREELRLVSATSRERNLALAVLKATQDAERAYNDPAKRDAYVAQQRLIAEETEKVTSATRDWSEGLTFVADKLDIIAGNIRRAGDGMAEAFGGAGKAIGDLAGIYASFQATRERLDAEHQQKLREVAKDEAATAREQQLFALRTSTLQIGAYGDMVAAAKGFFKEKSKGYQAMMAAEKVFRAFEFAMSVRAMVQDVAETVGAVSNSAARSTAAGAEGIANQSKLPFPFNIAAMAATAGALIAAGISVVGSLTGGKNTLPASNTGTGTVLGDPAAQSESIKNAINALKDVDTLMLNYSRQMASSLRTIESQIGNFASVLVRQGDSINANGGIAQGFNPNAIGSLLGNIPLIGGFLKGLFGTKTTVLASGLYAGAQSLGSILGGGFDASYYSDVQKKKKFLGITTSTKYSTSYSAADPLLENQFTLILRSFNDAIKAAAGPLGEATSTIQQRLNGFVVNIGKIDLQGLTGTQIEEKLNAVFGAAADNMARAAFPFIDQFQKAGEGAFETLIRVASTLEAVGSSLDLLGQSAQNMSIGVKLGLADQFDSISDLTNAVDAYFQAFYTKEEQAAARTAQMGKVFESLGLTMPTTLAGFRQLVEAQNLNTAAGRAAYATLLQLAPAFADLQAAMDGAKSAADIATERQDLQRQLLELEGDTAALRALQLAKLDESNRALQLQIWAIQDAQAAAKAADELRKAWQSVGDSIMDEVRRIRGLTDVAGAGGFAALMSQFNAATNAARGGDIDAAKSLPQLSQSLLAAAADAATSRQELDRIRAQIAASLEATYGLVSSLGGSAATSDAALLNLGASSQPAVVAVNDNGASISTSFADLRDEIAQQRADLNAGLATIAANTGKVAKKLEDVTAQSGGDAVSTVAAA